MSITENIAAVSERIEKAAQRAGRPRKDIALMAVTKTQPTEKIREAYHAGLHLFGENRVQEFSAKVAALADLLDADWHMIGHLQTNKAARDCGTLSRRRFGRLDEARGKTGCIRPQARQETECAHRNQRWWRSREERRSL